MKKIIFFLLPIFTLLSCKSIKEVPVQTVEKVVYRDSLVYVHDSITVKVPVEIFVENVLAVDTSYLKTSLAESIAYLDTTKKQIHHTLSQKGDIKLVYDTIIKTQNIDRFIERDVPVEVEVIKYKRDALFWVLSIWALICIIGAFLKIYLKK